MRKKSVVYVFIAVLMLMILNCNIYGASVNIYSNSSTLNVGDTTTITIDGAGVAGNIISVKSSNSSVISVGSPSSNWIENNKVTVPIKAVSTGTATVVVECKVANLSNSKDESAINYPVTITVKEKAQPTTPVAPPENTNNNNNKTNTNVPTNTNTQTNTAKNNNAYLSKLQVNQEGLTPNFNKTKTNYAITVGENVDSLKVTATPEASTSKVSVTGNTNLKNGDNKIYITVIAQDGTKKVYTITVTKTADAAKSNSYLQNLIVENATLSPEFSKEVFEYDCGTVGASVENLKILAFGENENVKVEITGNDKLVEGENTITVKVTSEDGTTTKEYVIKVKKDSSLVEENNIQEINSLQDTNNDNKIVSFFKNLWSKIKENWLLVLMYIFIIIEFFEIVYLYRHQERKVKKESNKKELKKTPEKNMTLDKEFKQNKKLKRNLDDNEKPNDINKRRNGRQKFDNND